MGLFCLTTDKNNKSKLESFKIQVSLKIFQSEIFLA